MTGAWLTADTLWQATGWTLAAAGACLLLWSLFWDRARGRKRCPKCWYDMGGSLAANAAGPWVCPECGKQLHREKQLRRVRQRWRHAPVGVVLLAGGLAALRTPAVLKHGWPAAVPDLVLAKFGVIEKDEWATMRPWRPPRGIFVTLARLPKSWDLTLRGWRLTEIQRRIDANDFSALACRIFLDRFCAEFPEEAELLAETPNEWPVGSPVSAELNCPEPLARLASIVVVRARLQGERAWGERVFGARDSGVRDIGRAGASRAKVGIEVEVLLLSRPLAPGEAVPSDASVVYRGVVKYIYIEPRRGVGERGW